MKRREFLQSLLVSFVLPTPVLFHAQTNLLLRADQVV